MSSAKDRRHRLFELAVLGSILAVYALLLGLYTVPVLGGPDANAYQVSARMVELDGRFHQPPREELAHVGRMWVVNDAGEWYPKYPPLYPALSGAVMKALGPEAGLWVSPVCAWLVVLGIYVLCRTRLPGWAALLGAFVMSTTPVFNLFAVDKVSHPPSLLFLVWGYALFFHGTNAAPARRARWFAAAGLLVGYSVGIRYPNALMALPPTLWLLLRWREARAAAVAWGIGLAVPAALLAWYHAVSFGHPLRTAYSLTEEQGGFGLGYFVKNLRLYLPALVTDGFGPLLVLSGLGFVTTWFADWRRGAFYTLWIAPLTALYISYYWAPSQHPPSYIRFLLPLTAAWILLALSLVRDLFTALNAPLRLRVAMIAVLVLAQGGWGIAKSLTEMETRYSANVETQRLTDFLLEQVPPGAALFADAWWLDELEFHGGRALYWDALLDQKVLGRALGRTTRLPGPDSLQPERARRLQRRLVDVEPSAYRAAIEELVGGRLAEGEVYLAGTPGSLQPLLAFWGTSFGFAEVAVLEPASKRYRLFSPQWSLSRAWMPAEERSPEVRVYRIEKRE